MKSTEIHWTCGDLNMEHHEPMDLGSPFSDKLGFAIQPTPTKILKKIMGSRDQRK